MTVTREQLLVAAYASSDDTERLVYADWLEQHGEIARAQVIHLQCELVRTEPFARRRREIEWELAALLPELGGRWADDLPVLDGVEWIELERGLPSAVRVRDVETLVAHGPAIHAAVPTVHTVELGGVASASKQLPELPWLRTLRVRRSIIGTREVATLARELEFDVGQYDDLDDIVDGREHPLERLTIRNNATITNELAQSLAQGTCAHALRRLEIPTSRAERANSFYEADMRLDEDGVANLAQLASVEALVIDRHDIGAQGLSALLRGLRELRELSARECSIKKLSLVKTGAPIVRLDLSANRLRAAGAAVLAKSPRMRELQWLALDTCEIDSLGLLELTRAPLWNTLRHLDLSRNPLGAGAARALADVPKPPNLHTLALADADFDEQAAAALAKVPWLGDLLALDLSGNLCGRGALALRSIAADQLRDLRLASTGMERGEAAAIARFWPTVVHLDLSRNPITDAGLERFVVREASALQTLALHDCKLGDDGLELLAQRGRAPRLRELDLGRNRFGAAMLEAFLRAPITQNLATLDFTHCELDADAIAALARTPMPRRLARLNLRGNELTEQMLLALAQSTTLRTVTRIDLDGNPFVFPPATRELIAARFGTRWYATDD